MTEKLNKAIEKVETAVEKAVDYVSEHPVKTLVMVFVAAKIMKWLKD
jgi:hypothetical protein